MNPSPTYTCAECGAPVNVQDDGRQIVRSCGCVDAPVAAGMAAVAKGAGGLRAG